MFNLLRNTISIFFTKVRALGNKNYTIVKRCLSVCKSTIDTKKRNSSVNKTVSFVSGVPRKTDQADGRHDLQNLHGQSNRHRLPALRARRGVLVLCREVRPLPPLSCRHNAGAKNLLARRVQPDSALKRLSSHEKSVVMPLRSSVCTLKMRTIFSLPLERVCFKLYFFGCLYYLTDGSRV